MFPLHTSLYLRYDLDFEFVHSESELWILEQFPRAKTFFSARKVSGEKLRGEPGKASAAPNSDAVSRIVRTRENGWYCGLNSMRHGDFWQQGRGEIEWIWDEKRKREERKKCWIVSGKKSPPPLLSLSKRAKSANPSSFFLSFFRFQLLSGFSPGNTSHAS